MVTQADKLNYGIVRYGLFFCWSFGSSLHSNLVKE